MSTVKETDIRPGGFFAAFDKADVERYKGVLPSYWKQWGYNTDSGYLTQLKSNTGVKAPSGKESIKIYRDILEKSSSKGGLHYLMSREDFAKETSEAQSRILDGWARETFAGFSQSWANGLDQNKEVQTYFNEVKARGFNALIDFNDSGNLAKTPVRLLQGSDFTVAGHIPVSKDEIKAAAKKIKPLVMHALQRDSDSLFHILTKGRPSVEEALAHFGVKGMKWGRAKQR